jgi:hypothetical protein
MVIQTSSSFAIAANTGGSFDITGVPDSRTSAFQIYRLDGATEQLGVREVQDLGGGSWRIFTDGDDTVAGQHVLVYQYDDGPITVTPAKQFTVTTFGPIHSCSCPCTNATSMVQKGEIIAVYVDHPNVPSGVVYAEVISASRDLSQAGNYWVYTLGIESTTLNLTKEHIKCFGCP